MTLTLWVILGLVAVAIVLMYAGAAKLERHHAMWEEFRHPPDQEAPEEEEMTDHDDR